MWPSDPISQYHLFTCRYVSMNASLSNQRGLMVAQTHLKGNILLCAGKVSWKNFEPFLRNITSKLVVSCTLLTRSRHITSLLLAMCVCMPVCQSSAAKWLPRLIWKEILSTLCRQSILKQFRAVFEKYNIKLSQLLTRSRHITSLLLAMCLSTPVCQTSAANWLPRLIWKEILSTLCRESIMK